MNIGMCKIMHLYKNRLHLQWKKNCILLKIILIYITVIQNIYVCQHA